MKSLFIFIAVVVCFGMYLRYLRRKEVEAFRDTDMVDFQTFKRTHEVKETPDPIMARAEAYAALNPGVVTLKPSAALPVDETPLEAPEPTLYRSKAFAFDEVTRNMLSILNRVSPRGVMVLYNVRLADFVRTEGREDLKLGTTRIAYLLCDSTTLAVLCGGQHRDAGATGRQPIDHVRSVFGDLGLPLLEFPVSNNISEDEVRDKLDPVLLGSEVQHCPKCGDSMTIRKAMKGTNAGDIFWVCNDFPACRGVIKV